MESFLVAASFNQNPSILLQQTAANQSTTRVSMSTDQPIGFSLCCQLPSYRNSTLNLYTKTKAKTGSYHYLAWTKCFSGQVSLASYKHKAVMLQVVMLTTLHEIGSGHVRLALGISIISSRRKRITFC